MTGIKIDGTQNKVVLDDDADTYFEAATDDTIKVYVAGAQDFTITANTLTAESGSTIAAQALTATSITATGDISLDGGSFVFNESSADKDFRVESNGQANMLFVDGGNDRVHINGSTGTREFNVSGDNTRLLLYSTNNSTGAGQLQFGDADNEQIGRIMYEHDGNKMTFHTAATEAMRIDGSGHITKPLQPAFHVPGTTQDNIASGISTVSFGGTERFDQNADFNTSNYTFTAPVTGRYYFSVHVQLGNLDNTHDYCRTHLVTSNNTYYLDIIAPDKIFSADTPYVSFQNSLLVDMDASDTAYVQINLNGGNGGQADLTVSQSYFSGFLAC